jgi:hypothetical protein
MQSEPQSHLHYVNTKREEKVECMQQKTQSITGTTSIDHVWSIRSSDIYLEAAVVDIRCTRARPHMLRRLLLHDWTDGPHIDGGFSQEAHHCLQ